MDIFTRTPQERVDGSNFNLSHSNKLSFNIGELIPTLCMEVLPGDKVNMDIEAMLRLAPLVSPVMHEMDVYHHAFYVPNRILWDDWEDFITGQEELEHPSINVNGFTSVKGKIGGYLGYQKTPSGIQQNAFRIAAYAKIYDEYYRAQYVETTEKFVQDLNFGNNNWVQELADEEPFRRAWEHDYFTSALPFPQVGDAVDLPLIQGDSLTVELDPAISQLFRNISDGTPTQNTSPSGQGVGVGVSSEPTANSAEVQLDPNGSYIVNIGSEAVDINTLREAFALQRYLEKEARSGSRYVEHLAAFFGVKSSDARLQRPEYIGGARQNMVISEVLTTAETENNPVGNLQGHGISVGKGQRFSFNVEEYGHIMVITSVRPKTAYSEGLHKSMTRSDRFDYGNPMFANLGEQEIKVGELWANAVSQEQFNETFGYIPRYSEYKYLPSRVHGEMRTDLEFWHMARIFDSKPVLNESFIHCIDDGRIFADTSPTSDKIYAQIQFNINSYRKLPKYGVPSIVG